uniref:glycerol-3-phosphate dehydrogenase C-terminal domain-containing protein n=1 Tax=Paraburkholderia sp. TaxID=1926495 RepID=UPI00260E00AE
SSGLVTVTGGKWTTYRKMAEDVLDAAFTSHLLEMRPCQTEALPLHGAPTRRTTARAPNVAPAAPVMAAPSMPAVASATASASAAPESVIAKQDAAALSTEAPAIAAEAPEPVAAPITAPTIATAPAVAPDPYHSVYGTDAGLVFALEGADEQIVPQLDLTIGQVRYAARCEFARTVEDVLARRHRGLLLNARAALAAAPRVALTLATELGHPPVWIEQQLKEFAKIAEPYRVTRRDGEAAPARAEGVSSPDALLIN